MTKFKVGDKVRVVDTTERSSFGIHEVFPFETVVTSVDEYDSIKVRGSDGRENAWYVMPEMLELIEDEPKVQVGDKVRVTKVYEFEVTKVHGNLVTGLRPLHGHFYMSDDPTNTIEVIEKATPKFEVGQVLTEVEELEALPAGAVVRREWLGTKTPPRAWTKTEAGEFHYPGMGWDRTAKEFNHRYGDKKITVVWLP